MSFRKDHVILVNERDEWLGTMEKLEAHQKGLLHRAFSVFVLNSNNEILLQQRATGKYHSAGLWSNTCCSHPMPGESTHAAAHRRLKEEMGFDCPLEPVFHLRYTSEVGNDLIENEYDHIYLGHYDGEVVINEEEAAGFRFISLTELEVWRTNEPEAFTSWFHLAMPTMLKYLEKLASTAV
ncbi:MAG: isopentenyl-diphosphate Delta-isomerase [Sphingobacteriales bacterium]|nr:MAG: isopentenyl-diphosphate Delta-isomerase [Sphingobacteriales bacterium]